jgi:hypothetical protein
VKVLIVLEDPTLDKHVVKPVVEKIFAELSRPARIKVLTDPHMRGASDVFGQMDEVVELYPMVDLFVVVMDRDCDRDGHEAKLASLLDRHPDKAVGCLAVQEVEVWMLAIQDSLPAPIREIRDECDPKEAFAEPWLIDQGYSGADVGRGRKAAMRALATNYRRLRSRCPEVKALEATIQARLT